MTPVRSIGWNPDCAFAHCLAMFADSLCRANMAINWLNG